ncbi:MAG: hypothetical protein U0175_02435 [Caldilineaceae bacterium]
MLLHLLLNLLTATFLYVLPGLVILRFLFPTRPFSWGEQIGLSLGLCLPLYPILALWTYVADITLGKWLAWLPGEIFLLFLLWNNRLYIYSALSTLFSSKLPKIQLFDLVWLIIVLWIAYNRQGAISQMVAPAWGDSVHHTMIVQLILDHNGLFQSWEPYAPIQTFTYHFGYHILIACWSWVSGISAEQAVLVGSQMLNLAAICVLYPLTTKLARGDQFAGICAIMVAGLFTQMPAYYVNWGRYTQLAAQVILPVFVWLLDEWLIERSKLKTRLLLGITLTSSGLALTHYRIAVISVTAGIAWFIWNGWYHHRYWLSWSRRLWGFVSMLVGAGLIVFPWLLIVQNGRLLWLAGALSNRAVDSTVNQAELTVWQSLNVYYPYFLWQIAVIGLLLGLWKNRYLSLCLLMWCGLSFGAANPFLLGLGGTGLVTNFLLIIGAYIVIAIVLGWLGGMASNFIMKLNSGHVIYVSMILILLIVGFEVQKRIVDTFYQLVTDSDIKAFSWIRENTSTNTRFLVNGFLAYGDSVVVGSDAGWWLPFYTKREATVPPILYSTEALPKTIDRTFFRQFVINVRESHGEQLRLREILCGAAITHVFIGEKQGAGGMGANPLIPTEWLEQNADFRLLHIEDKSQVWAFDRAVCDQS